MDCMADLSIARLSTAQTEDIIMPWNTDRAPLVMDATDSHQRNLEFDALSDGQQQFQ